MKKLILIIYAVVISATGLCALAFEEHLNIKIDSLIPLGVALVQLVLGLLLVKGIVHYRGGEIRLWDTSDFKYSKNHRGEGKFEAVESDLYTRKANPVVVKVVGYSYIIGGALPIPFIFFFSIGAKFGSIGLMLIPTFVGAMVAIPLDIMGTKAQREAARAEYEQQKRELEEQKKREELGRWK